MGRRRTIIIAGALFVAEPLPVLLRARETKGRSVGEIEASWHPVRQMQA